MLHTQNIPPTDEVLRKRSKLWTKPTSIIGRLIHINGPFPHSFQDFDKVAGYQYTLSMLVRFDP